MSLTYAQIKELEEENWYFKNILLSVCGPAVIQHYLNKISGPLPSSDAALAKSDDRIDLHVEVTPVSFDELSAVDRPNVSSKNIAERVVKAREMQMERFKDLKDIYSNAQMPSRMVSRQLRSGCARSISLVRF